MGIGIGIGKVTVSVKVKDSCEQVNSGTGEKIED